MPVRMNRMRGLRGAFCLPGRWAWNVWLDLRDRLAGRRNPLVPSRNRNFVGAGDYELVAQHFFELFRELGGLRPDDRVLDIGSGLGRMAVPLTSWLNGEYRGMEIRRRAVGWSSRAITSRHPRFQFVHADVHNRYYNRKGKVRASELRFPFDDGVFDFVFATSVFTHMFPADTAHYLAEAARVLRRGGTLFATFFLLTPESTIAIEQGLSAEPFLIQGSGFRSISKATPEHAVAMQESDVRGMYEECGLAISEPIHHGSWARTPEAKSYQDIVIAQRQG